MPGAFKLGEFGNHDVSVTVAEPSVRLYIGEDYIHLKRFEVRKLVDAIFVAYPGMLRAVIEDRDLAQRQRDFAGVSREP